MILSESCLEFCKFDASAEIENAERLAHDMIGNLNHGMCAFYDWNILLDEKGGPNHVNNFCDAPFMYHIEEKRLEQRKIVDYYLPFARYIKPGATRLGYSKYTADLDMTAWENPQGEIVVVLLNRQEKEIPCVLRIKDEMTTFTVKPHQIVTGVLK